MIADTEQRWLYPAPPLFDPEIDIPSTTINAVQYASAPDPMKTAT